MNGREPLETADVRLERRLGAIENGIHGVNARLDRMNGTVADLARWREGHDLQHARQEAGAEARSALRRRDWAYLTGLLGVVVALVQVLAAAQAAWNSGG